MLVPVADAYPQPTSPGVTAVMRGNRRRDTGPEVRLRSALHARGLRFRKDYRIEVTGLAVRADIAFPRQRLAVFVDGCFWHACPDHGTQPRSNDHYWTPKLRRNQERDVRVNDGLVGAGWTVVRAWEHQPIDEVAAEIESVLSAARPILAGHCEIVYRMCLV
jgi:DNA mismatch endonuclease (patch repair protein)